MSIVPYGSYRGSSEEEQEQEQEEGTTIPQYHWYVVRTYVLEYHTKRYQWYGSMAIPGTIWYHSGTPN